jgi:hypothetical protein
MILVVTVALALAAGIAPAAAAEPETEAADAAIEYITSLQNADGGFPAFGEESAAGSTIDVVFALVAGGLDPLTVTADGNSPADYLASQAEEYAEDPGAAATAWTSSTRRSSSWRSSGGARTCQPASPCTLKRCSRATAAGSSFRATAATRTRRPWRCRPFWPPARSGSFIR